MDPVGGYYRHTRVASGHPFGVVQVSQERPPQGQRRAVTPVRAVLFDFNGVLLDDETFHWRAFREILRPLGVTLSRARYDARYLVFDDRSALKAMLRDARRRDAPLEGLLRCKR